MLDDGSAAWAFNKAWGIHEGGRRFGQLEAALRALDIELASAEPDKRIGRGAAVLLGGLLLVSGEKVIDLVTTDFYEAITGARDQAALVEQCIDDEIESDRVKRGRAEGRFGGAGPRSGETQEVEVGRVVEREEAVPIAPSKSVGAGDGDDDVVAHPSAAESVGEAGDVTPGEDEPQAPTRRRGGGGITTGATMSGYWDRTTPEEYERQLAALEADRARALGAQAVGADVDDGDADEDGPNS
jgi:hypothetical protein